MKVGKPSSQKVGCQIIGRIVVPPACGPKLPQPSKFCLDMKAACRDRRSDGADIQSCSVNHIWFSNSAGIQSPLSSLDLALEPTDLKDWVTIRLQEVREIRRSVGRYDALNLSHAGLNQATLANRILDTSGVAMVTVPYLLVTNLVD